MEEGRANPDTKDRDSDDGPRSFGIYPLSYACKYLADPIVREQLRLFNEVWIEKDWCVFNEDYERAADLLIQQWEIFKGLDAYLSERFPDFCE